MNEFISFKDQKPLPNRWLLVTNNLNARDAHGEMSHLWLTTFWTKNEDNPNEIISFDTDYSKIRSLSHWRYAL